MAKLGMPFLKCNRCGTTTKSNGKNARNASLNLIAREALAERAGKDKDIDHNLTKKNIYLTDITTARELDEYNDKFCAELEKQMHENGERGLRKDAVVMINQIFKPSGDFMDTLTPAQQVQFLRDCVADFEEIIGHKITAGVIHLDEQVPHAHIFWQPTTADGKLNAKAVNNRSLINKINQKMPEMLRKQGYAIDDCDFAETAEEKAKKKQECGKSSATYKRQQQAQLRKLAEKNAEMEQTLASYTPPPTKKVKKFLGKEKEIPKTPAELQAEQQILIAQQILKREEESKQIKAHLEQEREEFETERAEWEQGKNKAYAELQNMWKGTQQTLGSAIDAHQLALKNAEIMLKNAKKIGNEIIFESLRKADFGANRADIAQTIKIMQKDQDSLQGTLQAHFERYLTDLTRRPAPEGAEKTKNQKKGDFER